MVTNDYHDTQRRLFSFDYCSRKSHGEMETITH